MSVFQNNDPLGYIDDLREALASSSKQALFPATASTGPNIDRWESATQIAEKNPELLEDAFTIVSSLGFCRLYGITLPEDIERTLSSPLTVELLVSAIIQCLQLLQSATEEAHALPDRFDEAEPLEDSTYCTSLLHQLMELWGAFIVIDDEYQQHVCAEQSIDSPFAAWMRRLLDAFNGLDDELQRDEQVQLLSIATELPLLENWRTMLVPPFRSSLPWWLDGTLEEAAVATRRLIEEDSTFSRPRVATDQPRARTLLLSRNEEIASQAADIALAASAGEVSGPAAEALLHTTWPIVGEATVRVRLELRSANNGQREIRVALIGPSASTQRYVNVEVGLRGGDTRQTGLELGYAAVPLEEHEIAAIVSLVLVEAAGTRRAVNLKGLSDAE